MVTGVVRVADAQCWSWGAPSVSMLPARRQQAHRRRPQGPQPTQDGHHWTLR